MDILTVSGIDSAKNTQTSLELCAALLEAVDDESILRAVMRVSCKFLGAKGCRFMPFDEFTQVFASLDYGDIPAVPHGQAPPPKIRQQCKACETRQGEDGCILLGDHMDETFIYCVPLQRRGRQTGLFSFVFPSKRTIEESAALLLAEYIHLANLALDSMERNRVIRSFEYSVPASNLSEETRSILPQIEYQAILGERMRLSREIHDGLAQSLAYLKLEINRADSMLRQGKFDQAAHILKDSLQTINDAYLDARQAIENLRRTPQQLTAWLAQVAKDFEDISGLSVELDLRLESEHAPNIHAQLIRIVQESLTNIRKHAGATQVRIKGWEDDETMLLEVADNGCGFDVTQPLLRTCYGLRGMRERADAIGADVHIDSHPGRGTTVRVQLTRSKGDG